MTKARLLVSHSATAERSVALECMVEDAKDKRLFKHKKSHGNEEESVTCDICGKVLKNRNVLKSRKVLKSGKEYCESRTQCFLQTFF